ncbi:hypothetical protein [Bradyrhizobium sp. STM 3557]|uniref:hypothetical protein n=1 Tax=Bradyrhizobium sp. STM 3557 TaxID=578920 RepID=UPI00389013A2
MISWGEIVSWLLQTAVAAGVAGMGFVVLLPTKLGEKYLGFHFDRKLADLKDQQNQEIEKLKEQLAHFGDRGKRSNEMEFAAIKLVWESFVEAYLATTTCALGYVEHPDFAGMSEAEQEAFIYGSDFPDREKERLRKAADKNKEYVAIVTWQQIARAGREQHQARLLLRKQLIFMPKDLSDRFMEAIGKLTAVFVQRKIGFQSLGSTDGFGGPIPEYLNNHEQMLEQLAALSNARLFRDEISPKIEFQRGRRS